MSNQYRLKCIGLDIDWMPLPFRKEWPNFNIYRCHDSEADEVWSRVTPSSSPHLWQLGRLCHNLPTEDDSERVSVFFVALLEGRVLPCMSSKSRPGVKWAGNLIRENCFFELRDWHRRKFHDEFEELWGKMLHEVFLLTPPRSWWCNYF